MRVRHRRAGLGLGASHEIPLGARLANVVDSLRGRTGGRPEIEQCTNPRPLASSTVLAPLRESVPAPTWKGDPESPRPARNQIARPRPRVDHQPGRRVWKLIRPWRRCPTWAYRGQGRIPSTRGDAVGDLVPEFSGSASLLTWIAHRPRSCTLPAAFRLVMPSRAGLS